MGTPGGGGLKEKDNDERRNNETRNSPLSLERM